MPRELRLQRLRLHDRLLAARQGRSVSVLGQRTMVGEAFGAVQAQEVCSKAQRSAAAVQPVVLHAPRRRQRRARDGSRACAMPPYALFQMIVWIGLSVALRAPSQLSERIPWGFRATGTADRRVGSAQCVPPWP